ncbi:MAG: c-type cytochrome domain-containing protein [Syntrophothermus sp.]
MIRYKIISFIIFSAAVAIAGCKDSITGENIDKRIIPATNVSFNKDIQPVFDVKCNSSSCHDDGRRAGGLSLTSYQNTTSDATIIVKGFPDNSRLYWAIRPGASNPMPPLNYPPLTENQIKGIYQWIKEGAMPN